MNTADVLLQLRALKPTLKARYKVKDVSLFGSFARGEQKSDSDIDILVEFENEADLFDLIGLELFLEEQLGCSVDVVPRKAIRKELQDRVLSQAIAI